MAALPHLQVLQDKYGKSGKFQVIGSHVQNGNPTKLLTSKKITWPTYQQLRHPEANVRGIPHMVLIDHKGKILKSGRVSDQEIAAAVKEAAGSSPLWDSVDVKHFKREVKNLQVGRPVKSMLTNLANRAKKGDEAATEAQALIDSVNKWGEEEMAAIKNLKATAPSKAYGKMEVLNKTFFGMPLVQSLASDLREMKKDKYLAYLISQRTQIARLKASKKRSESSKKYIVSNLQKFIDKYPASAALKGEAQDMISEVEAL